MNSISVYRFDSENWKKLKETLNAEEPVSALFQKFFWIETVMTWFLTKEFQSFCRGYGIDYEFSRTDCIWFQPEKEGRVGEMNLLFVCSQNRRRSLTAETMFDGVNGHRVRSAGTEKNARIKVTSGLIGWSDVIFCFEKKHLRRIQERYGQELCGKKVITMNVPDEYEYMDEELQEILRGFAEEYLS